MSREFRNVRDTQKRARIIVVDDHPIVRERLTEIINREPDLVVCGEAEDRSGGLQAIKSQGPDLVIIDLTLKSSDGLEMIKDIHTRWPKLAMLVVSMHDESLYAERVIRAGALGYITKQEATRKILVAIRRVLEGQIYVHEQIATQLLSRLSSHSGPGASGPAELLADRELQVFDLTGRGMNTREVAARLNISAKTVETYRARIREKLKLKDGSELLQMAIAWTHNH
jgi:DNA-binding NarL/FixJ family response regulator